MTAEHRLVFDLADIRGLRLECTRCHTAILLPLDQRLRVPADCLGCGAILTDRYKGVVPLLEQLAELLRTIAPVTDVPVRLRLEFDEPRP